MQNVHRENLDGCEQQDFDPKIACTNISNAIKDGVKDVCSKIREDYRYKFTVQTFISNFNSQSVNVRTRCLWDANTDRLVSENYVNDRFICSSVVVLIFFY